MSRKMAVGVIGAGIRADDAVKFALPEFDASIEVKAVADPSRDRAEKFRRMPNEVWACPALL